MSDDQEEVVDRKSDASSAKSIKSSIDGGAADRAAEETDKQAAMVALDQADQSIDRSQSNLTAANDDNSIATGCAFVTIPPLLLPSLKQNPRLSERWPDHQQLSQTCAWGRPVTEQNSSLTVRRTIMLI